MWITKQMSHDVVKWLNVVLYVFYIHYFFIQFVYECNGYKSPLEIAEITFDIILQFVLFTGAEQCVRALVDLPIDKISEDELARRPCQPATETLQKTMAIHSPHWPILRKNPVAPRG